MKRSAEVLNADREATENAPTHTLENEAQAYRQRRGGKKKECEFGALGR